jgi:hypothetical protein
MTRRADTRRRLSPAEVVFHTASGATIIATSPGGHRPRKARLRSALGGRPRRPPAPSELVAT